MYCQGVTANDLGFSEDNFPALQMGGYLPLPNIGAHAAGNAGKAGLAKRDGEIGGELHACQSLCAIYTRTLVMKNMMLQHIMMPQLIHSRPLKAC